MCIEKIVNENEKENLLNDYRLKIAENILYEQPYEHLVQEYMNIAGVNYDA